MKHRRKRNPATRAYWNTSHSGSLPEHDALRRAALVACYAINPAASSREVLAYFEDQGLGRLLGRDTCARRNSLHDLIHSAHGKRARQEVANAR